MLSNGEVTLKNKVNNASLTLGTNSDSAVGSLAYNVQEGVLFDLRLGKVGKRVINSRGSLRQRINGHASYEASSLSLETRGEYQY